MLAFEVNIPVETSELRFISPLFCKFIAEAGEVASVIPNIPTPFSPVKSIVPAKSFTPSAPFFVNIPVEVFPDKVISLLFVTFVPVPVPYIPITF